MDWDLVVTLLGAGFVGGLVTKALDLATDGWRRKKERQDEQRRWMRDKRLLAYSEFSNAASVFATRLVEVADQTPCEPILLDGYMQELRKLCGKATIAYGPLKLIAPAEISGAAHQLLGRMEAFRTNLSSSSPSDPVAAENMGMALAIWTLAANTSLRDSETEDVPRLLEPEEIDEDIRQGIYTTP